MVTRALAPQHAPQFNARGNREWAPLLSTHASIVKVCTVSTNCAQVKEVAQYAFFRPSFRLLAHHNMRAMGLSCVLSSYLTVDAVLEMQRALMGVFTPKFTS